MSLAKKWARQDDYDSLIRSSIAKYGNAVPFAIVKAMIARESDFNPRAYRAEPHINDASRGLMQVLLATARGMGFRGHPEELYQPHLAIEYGVKYVSGNVKYAREKGYDLDSALSAYNAGGSAERRGDGKRITNDRRAPFVNQAYVDWINKTAVYFEQWEKQKAAAGGSRQPADFSSVVSGSSSSSSAVVPPRPPPDSSSSSSGSAGKNAKIGAGLAAALAGLWLYIRGGR